MPTNEKEKETEATPPPDYHMHEATVPAHLVGSVSALGAAVAAGGLGALPQCKSSPEELARLVDRLQETFGAGKGAGNGNGKDGGVAPPPSPFTAGYTFVGSGSGSGSGSEVRGQQQKAEEADTGAGTGRKRAKYHAHADEVEDEHWR